MKETALSFTRVGRTNDLSLRAQALGVLAFAGDLSMGQPVDHSPRTALLAGKLALAAALGETVARDAMRLALLRWAGCTANAREAADLFGDDIAGRAAWIADQNPFVSRGGPPPNVDFGAVVAPMALAHCEAAGAFAARIGLGAAVQDAAPDIFEWWNGDGLPAGKRGEQIDIHAQLVAVAGDIDVFVRTYERAKGLTLVESRMGRRYDPALARAALRGADAWLAQIAAIDAWPTAIVGCELSIGDGEDVSASQVAQIVGDFADLKLPETAGASRRAARLAGAAARALKMGDAVATSVEQAASIHALGQVSVANTTLERVGQFGEAQWEQVRLIPYWTSRAANRAPCLAAAAEIASQAFERLDGSGYHRGLAAIQIPPAARVVQCAVLVEESLAGRPWRAAATLPALGAAIDADSKAGRLDPVAAAAVLAVAGAATKIPDDPQASLTARECEVLGLLVRGHSNKAIARMLAISPSTAGTHVENIYRKLGVGTRAAATLRAFSLGILA